MTNLFKPSMPDTSAQEAAMKRQEELLQKQEERAIADEREEQQRIQAQMRARRTGGMRSLLSPGRLNPQTGLSSSLGGSYSE
jgi:hypothetical protein